MEPPQAIWVRWSEDGRCIVGQWSFGPFEPERCAELGIIKYVATATPETPATALEIDSVIHRTSKRGGWNK